MQLNLSPRNYLLALLLLLISAAPLAAQSAAKIEKKAAAKVDQLDRQIAEENTDLALTEIQRTLILDLYVGMYADIKALKGESDEKERKKAARRAVNQTVNKEILTAEQRKAKRRGKSE